MSNVLVCYATRNGSTQQIAEAVAQALRDTGATVELRPAGRAREPLTGWDLVVLGGPLYNGGWHRDARRFARAHRADGIPIAVFACGPREDTQPAWQRANAQFARVLGRLRGFTPVRVAVFGGADPAGTASRRDLRDWAEIRRWAVELPVPVP